MPKPSEGLEYTYARKPSNFDHEKKDLAHIWELGGSAEFAEEFVQGDAGFLNPKQVSPRTCVRRTRCVPRLCYYSQSHHQPPSMGQSHPH